METKGNLLKKYPVKSGVGKNGKNWSSCAFLIETEETYPRKIFIETMSPSVIEALENYQTGFTMTVSINIESREYNERWYNTVSAWKIQGDESNKASSQSSDTSSSVSDDLPF